MLLRARAPILTDQPPKQATLLKWGMDLWVLAPLGALFFALLGSGAIAFIVLAIPNILLLLALDGGWKKLCLSSAVISLLLSQSAMFVNDTSSLPFQLAGWWFVVGSLLPVWDEAKKHPQSKAQQSFRDAMFFATILLVSVQVLTYIGQGRHPLSDASHYSTVFRVIACLVFGACTWLYAARGSSALAKVVWSKHPN